MNGNGKHLNGNGNGKEKLILIIYDAPTDKPLPDDPESEYTLLTARTEIESVRAALKEGGYAVRTMGLHRINAKVIAKIEEIDPDAIFNLCESLYDQAKHEMYVAGLFELLKIPYTGSPPFALGLALNKRKTKQILRAAGLPTPASVLTIQGQPFSLSDLDPPYIIKPVREDASVGIDSNSVVHSKEEAIERVNFIHENYHQPALVEEFIDGKEIHVSILGQIEPRVLAIGEVDFAKMPKNEPKIISYQAKWDEKSPLYDATEIAYPANLAPEVREKIERVAIRAFQEVGCRDYARVDLRLRGDDKFFILEVNTNPDIMFETEPEKINAITGLTYTQLVCEIAAAAMARSSRKKVAELALKSVI